MTATLAFHIKTIPDTDGLRILYDLPQETSAEDVANIAYHQARQQHVLDLPNTREKQKSNVDTIKERCSVQYGH